MWLKRMMASYVWRSKINCRSASISRWSHGPGTYQPLMNNGLLINYLKWRFKRRDWAICLSEQHDSLSGSTFTLRLTCLHDCFIWIYRNLSWLRKLHHPHRLFCKGGAVLLNRSDQCQPLMFRAKWSVAVAARGSEYGLFGRRCLWWIQGVQCPSSPVVRRQYGSDRRFW